jgi:hypothetical protein
MLFALAFSVWALIDWARLSSLYTIGAHGSDPRSLLIWMSPIILWALIEPLFNVTPCAGFRRVDQLAAKEVASQRGW